MKDSRLANRYRKQPGYATTFMWMLTCCRQSGLKSCGHNFVFVLIK